MVRAYLLYKKCPDSNRWELYAWSDSKKDFDEFKSVRKELNFFEKKIKFDYYSDFEVFRSEKNAYKIRKVQIQFNRGMINVPCLKNIISTDNEMDTIRMEVDTFPFFIESMSVPPDIFSGNILRCLDILGYVFIYYLYLGYDSLISEADYNMSYNMSPLGQPLNVKYNEIELLANFIVSGGEIKKRLSHEDL